MAKRKVDGPYVIENHSKLIRFKNGPRRRYYHRLVCTVPERNIVLDGDHMSRSGRLKAIRRVKENPRYADAKVVAVKK